MTLSGDYCSSGKVPVVQPIRSDLLLILVIKSFAPTKQRQFYAGDDHRLNNIIRKEHLGHPLLRNVTIRSEADAVLGIMA